MAVYKYKETEDMHRQYKSFRLKHPANHSGKKAGGNLQISA